MPIRKFSRSCSSPELVLLRRTGQVDEAIGIRGQHKKEAAAVDVPCFGALVEEAGRALGVDDEDLAAGAGDGGAVGKGLAADEHDKVLLR